MKTIYILMIGICVMGMASAAQDTNTTNIVDISNLEGIGGTDYIVPHQHYWDSWFAVYNDGRVSYNVYMYQYDGSHPDNYTNTFIGILRSDEVITLNSNASYRFYADYDDIQDIGDIEVLEKRFNQYWFIIVVSLIIIIGGYYLYRKVRYQ